MKNYIRPLLALGLLSACSAPDSDIGQLIDFPDQPELGLAAQTYLAPQRGSLRFGVGNDLAALSCDSATPAQQCAIPASKQVNWYVQANVGSTAADRTLVRNQVVGFISEMTSNGLTVNCADPDKWCFTEVAAGSGLTTLAIEANGAGSGVGGICSGAATTAEAYTCLFGATNGLTEDGGVVNPYLRRTITTLHVDVGDILARGTTAAEDSRGMRAATYNGMLKALGVGAQTFSPSRCSQRIVSAASGWFAANCLLSTAEICALNGFTELGDQTHFGNRQTQCGS